MFRISLTTMCHQVGIQVPMVWVLSHESIRKKKSFDSSSWRIDCKAPPKKNPRDRLVRWSVVMRQFFGGVYVPTSKKKQRVHTFKALWQFFVMRKSRQKMPVKKPQAEPWQTVSTTTTAAVGPTKATATTTAKPFSGSTRRCTSRWSTTWTSRWISGEVGRMGFGFFFQTPVQGEREIKWKDGCIYTYRYHIMNYSDILIWFALIDIICNM